MHHPVDILAETNEETKFGDRLDLALDNRTHRMFAGERFPRIFLRLL